MTITREEWYKHKVLDSIELLCEYVDILRDGAIKTTMSEDEVDSLYHGLCVMSCDITFRT